MGKRKRFGAELIEGLTELRDALQRGERLDNRFTVRTVRLKLEPGAFDAKAVRATRAALGVSQAVFAEIMGASPATIEAWEQGVRTPSPMARRLLEEINADRQRWLKRLRAAVVAE